MKHSPEIEHTEVNPEILTAAHKWQGENMERVLLQRPALETIDFKTFDPSDLVQAIESDPGLQNVFEQLGSKYDGSVQ